MHSEFLINKLITQTHQIIAQTNTLLLLDINSLQWRENNMSWNILECIQHLNLYGAHYLQIIEKSINNSSTMHNPQFKSGLLGNYFAKSMLPKAKLNKMKTFKDKNPIHEELDNSVFRIFMNQLDHLLLLLQKSIRVDMNTIKIPTSIASFIKMNLGDTFQFFINHMIRHMQQIEHVRMKYKTITVCND